MRVMQVITDKDPGIVCALRSILYASLKKNFSKVSLSLQGVYVNKMNSKFLTPKTSYQWYIVHYMYMYIEIWKA